MPAYDKLHASGEDYLEAILILQQKQGMVRSVDVARCMERYTFCTRMANAGMNPKALQYIMGHANIVMTLNYYAHATFHSAQEEMDRLEAKAEIKVVNTEKIEAAA